MEATLVKTSHSGITRNHSIGKSRALTRTFIPSGLEPNPNPIPGVAFVSVFMPSGNRAVMSVPSAPIARYVVHLMKRSRGATIIPRSHVLARAERDMNDYGNWILQDPRIAEFIFSAALARLTRKDPEYHMMKRADRVKEDPLTEDAREVVRWFQNAAKKSAELRVMTDAISDLAQELSEVEA